jgi:hypothetical protein
MIVIEPWIGTFARQPPIHSRIGKKNAMPASPTWSEKYVPEINLLRSFSFFIETLDERDWSEATETVRS